VIVAGFDVGQTVAGIVDGLVKVSESVKVIGEPIEAAGKVIIPAVVVRVAFGAGGGSGISKSSEEDEGTDEGGGGGGGGGVTLMPVFLVVDAEGERLITVPSTAATVLGKAKEALDRVLPRRDQESDEQAAEEA
jgi:uncharacterized spore protein YtfJ